jgi:C4-dicarboxylate-binding protein DctP
MRSTNGCFVAGSLLALVWSICMPAQAQTPIVIRFSHVVSADAPKGKTALRFKELAERHTRGRVRVEVYSDSTLYKDREELEALQLGAVQMLAPALAKFGPLGIPEFEIFDFPFLFPDSAAVRRVQEGAVGQALLGKLKAKGLTGLAYWDNGFKVMSANRPLHLPADFKGLRMRVQSSRVLAAQMRALGALPEAMGFSDVFDALRRGVVDGTENPPSNFLTREMQQVQGYLTVSRHGYLGYAVIVNTKFWEGLPRDIRGQLGRAVAEAANYAATHAEEENAKALEKVRQSGKTTVHFPSEAEQLAWRAALLPVHAEMAGLVGKDTLEAVKREIARVPLR